MDASIQLMMTFSKQMRAVFSYNGRLILEFFMKTLNQACSIVKENVASAKSLTREERITKVFMLG